ncbi:MAG: hypothetical protein HQ553_19055 [Chloroflexi bacterium]|nr:hypothetical protein [Chloroflexota bacterium]
MKKRPRNQEGFAFIEALLALVILGTFGTVLLGGLAVAAKATPLADETSTAQNLAETQMEYVLNQDYDYINDTPQYLVISDTDVPEGYSISSVAERLDADDDDDDDDDGIQKIEVSVQHWDETVTILEGYRIRQ